MTATQVPIDDGLFTWPSPEPRLIGSRCARCGTVTFPRQHGCPKCTAEEMEDLLLERRGKLWTWTTQGFRPKWPYTGPDTDETFVPYAVGYVELPGQVRVETRLTEADPAKLRIGMEMELVIVAFKTDDAGNEVMSFAFAPTGADRREAGEYEARP